MLLLRADRLLIILISLSFWVASAASSQELLIEIEGGEGASVTLTRDALEQEPQTEIVTSTLWTDAIHTFTGVPLRGVLMTQGWQGADLELIALNDYAVTIPFEDLEDNAPIIATRMDGEVMSVRDKGPFWVIYPFDDEARYQTETVYARSIWQLRTIRPKR